MAFLRYHLNFDPVTETHTHTHTIRVSWICPTTVLVWTTKESKGEMCGQTEDQRLRGGERGSEGKGQPYRGDNIKGSRWGLADLDGDGADCLRSEPLDG